MVFIEALLMTAFFSYAPVFSLLYTKHGSEECVGYSDSDWAGDSDVRRSTSGYIFKPSGASVSWRSKKQTSVALSTAEAEYFALFGIGNSPTKSTVIFKDNQSAIY